MCGIAGFLDPDRSLAETGAASAALRAMTDCLAHRGPDDEGGWIDPSAGIALGHRRLAIVELSESGRQPMHSASGRYTLVFNGEIYNFERLRAELPRPVAWRGRSDTEVLLAAIEAWGLEEALRRSIGMFALALWDSRSRTLSLARDRVGKKPLCYGWLPATRERGRLFAFASELGAVRRLPGFDPAIDPAALASYLRFLYVPAPFTVHPGIHKLEPGAIATLRLDDAAGAACAAPTLHRFWNADDVALAAAARPFDGSPEEAVDQLERLLADAVTLRMIADVPLGGFLSGGIDSSVVVALMQSVASRPVRTFTIGFREAEYDEARHAAEVARHLGTDHTELTLTAAEALAIVPEIARRWDEPFADASQVPTFLVAQLARRHVTVALSGDGGDELFGGYNRYAWARRIWRSVSWMPHGARRALGAAARSVPPRCWDRAARAVGAVAGRHRVPPGAGSKMHKLAALVESPDVGSLYARLVSAEMHPERLVPGAVEAPSILARRDPRFERLAPAARMMHMDFGSYLVDDIMVKVDRATMAVALESRAPLLDHRIVEFAWSLPMSIRMKDGIGKWPLRSLLARHVPPALTERPKQGFGVPIAEWLGRELRPWAEDLLSERSLRADGLLDAAAVRSLWAQYLGGATTRWPALWGVLMYRSWRAGLA
ncbi:MAG TPA: asparagine synthase (glutamine-hydrolyzing) [Phycisphaerales bacterium]|nr:asparagine synthase (glutamine-hydrolyzing) [Phycisphaerales bacterium]HMP37744.1 asparagine synthase (glutamine-hydrolyzing) [Phycisphaerales bacterium]